MTQFRGCGGAERAAALDAIRHEGISASVLERGLIAAGVPESEWRGLKKRKAAKLLHWTLVQDALKACAVGLASDHAALMLPVLVRAWRAVVEHGERAHEDACTFELVE